MNLEQGHPTSLRARSERQAMDWGLALLSQGIESTVLHDDAGWHLQVSPEEIDRATQVVQLYRRENRRWIWRREFRTTTVLFHWGALVWCLILAFIDAWSAQGGGVLHQAGQMNSLAVRAGEWWRLFTATTLHADLAHLAANLTLGFLLLGLAMARWGAGPGLLSTLLAGTIGNLASFLASPTPHSSLGASGMVMGALGLLATGVLLPRPAGYDWRAIVRGLGGGVLLFILLGLNPASDVVAHLGGFLAGLLFGGLLTLVPELARRHPLFELLTGALAGGTLIATWAFALTG